MANRASLTGDLGRASGVRSGGIAQLASRRAPLTTPPNTDDPSFLLLQDSGRWQERRMHCGDGGTFCDVANMWGFTGAATIKKATVQNEHLLNTQSRVPRLPLGHICSWATSTPTRMRRQPLLRLFPAVS